MRPLRGEIPRSGSRCAMTKSAVRLAREVLVVGRIAVPVYGSRYSKYKYTQP